MKQVIHKAFWVWEFQEEERWLNEMSAKGLHLTDASLFRYVFEEGVPGAYQYRLELLENFPNHPESRKYLEFMEETGAEVVSTFKRWVYFRRKADSGAFDLYSDIDSRIAHMKRIINLLTVLATVEGVCVAMELASALFGHVGAAMSMTVLLAIFEAFLLTGLRKMKKIYNGLISERAIRE